MPANFRWNGDALRARLEREFERRIKAATILVWNHWKSLISEEGTTKTTVVTTDAKGRKRKRTKLAYNTNPSQPGSPPHVQTGQLRASAAWEVDKLVGRVGSNLKKLLYLELGTSHMAARPSLRRALIECMAQVQAILGAPLNLG